MATSLVRKVIGPLSRNFLCKQADVNKTVHKSLTTAQHSISLCSQGFYKSASFQTFTTACRTTCMSGYVSSLLQVCSPFVNPVRTMIRYSRRRGKPKTVVATIHRFLRLDWGIYIRPRAGRKKHAWKKPEWIRERSKYHVFCNKSQSKMLDKMRTQRFKKVNYFVNDPYAPYHKRTGMPGQYTPPKYLP